MKKLFIVLVIALVGCTNQASNNQNSDNTITFPKIINYPQKALERYGNAEKSNDPIEINALANMYFYGFGVNKNIDKAKQLYLKAANLGYGSGYYNLGLSYIDEGILGYKTARKYFELAMKSPIRAFRGYDGMGDLYAFGYGVEPDLERAKDYYLKAIQLGSNDGHSEARLSELERRRNNHSEAKIWHDKALKKGYNFNEESLEQTLIRVLGL